MEMTERFQQLLGSLAGEISTAVAGSDQGQFPILDLLGNLRDETAGIPDLADLHKGCADAWEKVVRIVESGKPFAAEEIDWLKTFPGWIQKFAAGESPAAMPAAAAAPAAAAQPKTAAPAGAATEPAELPLNLNLADDAELLREFINESREHLDNIEQGVLVLENHPDDAETLNTIFRAFHTFKGGAGFLNLTPINRLAHVLESLLDLARRKELTISQPVIELILRGRDVLKQFLDEIAAQANGERPVATITIPTAALKAEIQVVLSGGAKATPQAEAAAPVPAAPVPAALPAAVPASIQPPAPANAAEHAGVVKVDTGKLDSLLDLVGELVIGQSLVAQHLNTLADLNPQFARNMALLARTTKELQRVSMTMRMMPVRGLFQKMARVVRDIGTKQKKQVQLVTDGEDTELDRGVVEALHDPLLHMIRNSVDHGIEAADQRTAAGKSAMGTIRLRASHQGGNILIEICDDGAGLNRDRILAKAVERGLVSPGTQPSDEEVFAFIFAAGFSTAEKVTDLSGRGVGLDVVRRNVEGLRGRVDISSVPGQGTTFKITLPLTLAIIDGLCVQVGAERYIIPALSVRESFRPAADMITKIQNRAEVVNVRGRILPLLRLHEFFGVAGAITDVTQGIIVVVQAGSSVRCLLVDRLLHKQEVVIKNVSELLARNSRGLAGATILGDGRVSLILDVNALVHCGNQEISKAA
jgi:two-component system chemotaxis sensor kinase CheA